MKYNEQMFLYENFFFRKINKTMFCKKYFNEFIYKEFAQGEKLFSENDPVDFLYFIKEGEVKLHSDKNVLQLNNLYLSIPFFSRASAPKCLPFGKEKKKSYS